MAMLCNVYGTKKMKSKLVRNLGKSGGGQHVLKRRGGVWLILWEVYFVIGKIPSAPKKRTQVVRNHREKLLGWMRGTCPEELWW